MRSERRFARRAVSAPTAAGRRSNRSLHPNGDELRLGSEELLQALEETAHGFLNSFFQASLVVLRHSRRMRSPEKMSTAVYELCTTSIPPRKGSATSGTPERGLAVASVESSV